MTLQEVLIYADYFIAAYFLGASLSYLTTLILAAIAVRKRKKEINDMDLKIKTFLEGTHHPKVTLIVPAYNEEKIISSTVMSFMSIYYPALEILVIDDCSTDMTSPLMIEVFDMVPVQLVRQASIKKSKVLETFQSKRDPRLKLVRQSAGGKAGALNTGIDYATGELIVTVDADTVPEEDAILRMVLLYLTDRETIKGISGTVRILNGAKFREGASVRGHLPTSWICRLQIVEYIRAFYCGRIGWDQIDSTLLMSGAFSLFNRNALVEVKGFNETSITEDFEIVVRMRQHFGAKRVPARFRMLPEPICWTQAPQTLKDLRRQRIRWQKGLVATLKDNLMMLFNYKYGITSLTHFPYMVVYEWMGPFIELMGYLCVIASLATALIGFKTVLLIILAGVCYSVTVTVFGIHLEQSHYTRSHTKKDLLPFLMTAILENFGYRQLTWFWRLEAMLRMPFEKNSWGVQPRQELMVRELKKKTETEYKKSA